MLLTILFYVFISCLIVQLIFYLFYYSKLAFYNKDRDQKVADPEKSVSLIVCAHNEEENLKKLFSSLARQNHPDFEIIVINDRSTDDTELLLQEKVKEFSQLRIIKVDKVPEGINGKKYGLSLGIKLAKNDIILFTDADCYPISEDWITEMTAPFNDSKKIVLGYSQYEKKPGLLNAFIRYETLYTGILYLSSALAGAPYMGVGRNIAHRKSFFLENKGFRSHLKVTGGDDDLYVNENANKKNTGVAVGPKTLVYSYPKSDWASYFTQKKRHLSVGKLYKFSDKFKLNLLAVSQLLFWITFIILMITWKEPYIVLAGFLVRIVILCSIFYRSSRKLGDNFSMWLVPGFDLLFVFYYFVTGYLAFFSKNIKWK
jgi:glycosyltransferase involved in cell wall biosynthesis